MQDYRRRQFDEDDRRDRYDSGRQRDEGDRSWRDQGDGGYASPRRGEGYGPHSEMDDARYTGSGDGWAGEDERGPRGWRGDDGRWSGGRGNQRDYGQYAPGRPGGSAEGWGREWGGYSGGRSGGDFSGGSYGGRDYNTRSQNGPGGGRAEWPGRRDWGGSGASRSGAEFGSGSNDHRFGRGDWSSYARNPGGGWGQSGQSYAGRGPKDYQRSDERIREEISDRLTDDGRIDASDISVQVMSCEVTLTGTVTDREQKRCAEDLVESISGVKEVTNNIRVARSSQGDRQDRPDRASSAIQAGSRTEQGQMSGTSGSSTSDTGNRSKSSPV